MCEPIAANRQVLVRGLGGTMKRLLDQVPSLKQALVTLFLAFVGGVTGGLTQQYFAVQLEEEKKLLELRKDAYSDFFKGQAILQRLREMPLSDGNRATLEQQYSNLVKNARFLIAIYSSKQVVESLADLFMLTGLNDKCGGTPEQWDKEVETYQNMRRELFGYDWRKLLGIKWNREVDDDKLMLMMFSCYRPK